MKNIVFFATGDEDAKLIWGVYLLGVLQECSGCGQLYSIVSEVKDCLSCCDSVSYKCEKHPEQGSIDIPYCNHCEELELEEFKVQVNNEKKLSYRQFSIHIWTCITGYIFCFSLLLTILASLQVINVDLFIYTLSISVISLCFFLPLILKAFFGRSLIKELIITSAAVGILTWIVSLIGIVIFVSSVSAIIILVVLIKLANSPEGSKSQDILKYLKICIFGLSVVAAIVIVAMIFSPENLFKGIGITIGVGIVGTIACFIIREMGKCPECDAPDAIVKTHKVPLSERTFIKSVEKEVRRKDGTVIGYAPVSVTVTKIRYEQHFKCKECGYTYYENKSVERELN